MVVCDSIHLVPSDLEFAVFSSDEIKRMSVVRIITGLTFDELGEAVPGGLYDPSMGPAGLRSYVSCVVCGLSNSCPGHVGHIELAALVYNPLFKKLAQRILSMACLHCFKFQIKDYLREMVELQFRLIDAGFIAESREVEQHKFDAAVSGKDDVLIKLEDGGVMHPRIAELHKLVADAPVTTNATKTCCSDRTSLVNSIMQRPSLKHNNKCIHCKKQLSNIRYSHQKIFCYLTAAEISEKKYNTESTATGGFRVIFADECRKYLRKIYENTPELLDLLFPIFKTSKEGHSKTSPVDLFFMDTVVVTPPKARPVGKVAGKLQEHPSTNFYRNIIENDAVLRVILKKAKGLDRQETPVEKDAYEKAKGETQYEKFYNAWGALQLSVDVLLDTNASREYIAPQGLKQVIEKKEGLLRKHMMGKRVNFAARTVITPDPNINVDEVGVPDVFARKLSFPVPVTPWNVSQLRKMVMNGPDVHPGANLIELENSHKVSIPRNDPVQREALAKRLLTFGEQGAKIVHRHIVNGDVVLLNRQPSLHRPSIMAHKVRVLSKEKTFRLHYSNCKAYNADFDGDEMNAHFPQSEVARSEAYNLVNVANNYLSPKDGTPLGGLIQDHVISGVKLSMRGRFFNQEDYHQMIYQGLANKVGNIKLLPPAILKPFKLWSGKQVLSTIIINTIPGDCKKINLLSSAHIPAKQWQTMPTQIADSDEDSLLCEHTVAILNGELLLGVLDKKQYGATTFGLIHCVYELYGGEVSTRLLTAFTKLFTYFLQREGFSLGVKDILVTKEADAKRRKVIKKSRQIGPEIVGKTLDVDDPNILEEKMKEAYNKDPKFRVLLDRKYKSALDEYTNSINKICVPNGLISRFPDNNLQLMILSGAKGSLVNAMQISCLLGQIELEGKRPPLMISGKALPSFATFETSPKSGGFIDGRFMTGIQPQDFFFHCMAGREGLIDTAVKTSRSGYLQRCLIKHLEGLQIGYDLTVRDSDNTVVQFLYGEDGLDIGKAKFLHTDVGRKILLHNEDAILNNSEAAAIKDDESLSKIKKHNKQITKWQKAKQLKGNGKRKFQSAFTSFCAELRDEIETKKPAKINSKTGRRRLDANLIKLWQKPQKDSKAQELKELFEKKHSRCPDPVISLYKPDSNFGAVSEAVENIISRSRDSSNEMLRDVLCLKSLKAIAPPGEPVGLLAAQSIGEPSTQMTLNTFHFAGRGEMNVTLGIPRLREILMMASTTIKTPSMDVPILPEKNRRAEKLRIQMNRVTLSNVLEKIDVSIKTVLQPERATQYQLRLKFLPRKAYQDDYCVKPKQILKYVNSVFLKHLFRALMHQSSKEKIINVAEKEEKSNQSGDGEDESEQVSRKKKTDNGSSDEEGDNDEDDATNIKLKSRKQDENDYDDPDDIEEIEDADAGDNDNDDDDVQLIEKEDLAINLNEDEDEENEKTNEKDDLVQNALKYSMVQEYVYDKESYLWCKITFNLSVRYKTPDISTILKELAEKSVIHQINNIKRAIICKDSNDALVIKTDGINIPTFLNLTFRDADYLDLNRLYANDIHAIAQTYGIEAAASVLIKEVTNVFKVYGINIDRRHLSLIADYMTFDGTYQPLSRRGMEHSASPLQQMTFESSLQFLRNATIAGRKDELNSPSSRLIMGLPIRNGTGSFDLLTQYPFKE